MVRFSCFHTHKTKGMIQPSCHQRNPPDDIHEILNKLDLRHEFSNNQAPLETGCCSADDAENNEYPKKCWSLGSELEQVGVASGGSSEIDEQDSHTFQLYNVEYVKDSTGSELGEACVPLDDPNGPHVPFEVPLVDPNGPHDEANGAFVTNENETGGQIFNLNRTEQWVRDLQHCSSFEDTNELISKIDQEKSGHAECKSVPALDAVKNYISSLSSTSTSAQLANYGLVMVPFLSPFGCLKALNLSGNSIVKLSSGVLPRGLHMLNLSKNNIMAIEGLRELTRLRVLDLSYNRIFKIGHGLASCSSLKELYLAGNKISEVEGLHRLLKLHILDLRFNKISTAKCLGQLAANYNSLHAISLEGNPAQKNVGDEQLKKHLQSLLPNLAFYNRQQIRSGLLKDGLDRSTRLGISPSPLDRVLKGNHKNARKGIFGSQAVVLPRRSRGSRLPPSAGGHHQQQYVDVGGRGLGLSGLSSMRRSRSEGTLGAL